MLASIPPGELTWYGLEWAIRIGALAVVPMRRTPAAARAWLLLIFFLPVPGLLLFLAIGSPRFPVWRRERFNALGPWLAELAGRQRSEFPPDLGAAQPIATLAERLGQMTPCGGNHAELIDDYDATIARLVADIDGARHSVRIMAYIFADDPVGQAVAGALGRAVARGVAVRVMFDPVGSARWRKGTRAMLSRAGVEWREALPFRLLRGRTRRDMRNHRKLYVIDGAIGYAGSQNIVARDFRPGVVNRELIVRVTGPVVASMAALIDGDWSLETGDAPPPHGPLPAASGDAQLQLLPSGAAYPFDGFQTILVWQLHQARERVIIVTPYFIPDDDILSAMRSASARGVRVDLVVSAVVDQRLVNLSQSSFYDELLAEGVRIHRYRHFLLHAKALCVDGELAIVGSSNVDLRSFTLNEEASLILYDRPGVARAEAILEGYVAGSDPIDLATWRRRPLPRKLAENAARLLNSLL